MPVPTDYSSVDSIRPVNYLRVLLARKGTLALFGLTGLLLGILMVWHLPYTYRSHAYLEVSRTNDDLLNKREFDPTAKDDDSSQVYVNTVARLLQSGPLYVRAAAELNSQTPKWNPPITSKEIAASTRVITHEMDRIVDVAVDSIDPKRAAAIANGITTSFVQQDLDSRWKASYSTSEWLRKEIDDLAGKLHSSEDQLQAFTQKANLLVDDSEGGVADSYVRNIQTELARAQADRMNKEALYEDAKLNGATAILGTDTTYDQYQLQLTTLEKQLAELEATYAPGYYKIPPLKAQIAQVQKALDAEKQTAIKRAENDYRASLRREDLLHSQYNTQVRNATDQASKMVQYEALKNQVEMNRGIYSLMMQKVKGYSVAAAMQTSNVRVVDPAVAPLLPVRPNKPMMALLTSFGFLCAGTLWLLVRAGGNRTIMEPGESAQYLNAPELGVIPTANRSGLRLADRTQERIGLHLGNRRRSHVETVSWGRSSCQVAESFRSASASILLPDQGNQGHRVLVVTSLSPSEGKTTVATNMAITLAGVAGQVLLIDGDRRRARLHSIFGCENEKGMADLLDSGRDPRLSDEECIVQTAVPNLFLLPSGGDGLTSSDALYSDKMAELIDRFRSQFNVVLIDTPPLMNLADARVFGRMSDGVILVIRAGRVPWESAKAAEQRLREDGITVLGTVLNDWNPSRNGYGVYPYSKHVESYFAA